MADIYIGNVKGPQGDTGATGPQGAAGAAATVQVGTVSTTAYGNPAQVTNSGTEHAAVLNFTIPQGAPGATVTQLDNLALNTITTSTDQYPQIQVGDIGRVIFGKIIKFFQDLVTGLAAKVNYSDALTMEEIEAASDLTDKVSAAAASKTIKDALSSLDDSVTSLVSNLGNLYSVRIENIQSKDKLQIRQTRTGNTAQSFLIIGSTTGTNTVLAVVAVTTGTQTLKVTSLGQQTVAATLSASPDYYPQAVVGNYFSGIVLSLYPFTVVPY